MLGLLELLSQPLYPVMVARRQSVAMGKERVKELNMVIPIGACPNVFGCSDFNLRGVSSRQDNQYAE